MAQKIQVILESMVKGEEKVDAMTRKYQKMGGKFSNISNSMVKNARKQQQSMDALAKKNRFLRKWTNKLGVNTNMLNKSMSSLGWTFDNTGKVVDKAGRGVKQIEQNLRRATVAVKPFKFEWLSVMFAGMAVQRAVSGLLRTSIDWMGVMDVLSNTLGVFFLPVAEILLDWALKFMDVLSEVSPATRKTIGIFTLFVGVLGTAAMIFGQIMLGVGGLVKLFPGLTAAVAKAGGGILGLGKIILGFFTGLSAPILIAIAAITAIVIGAVIAWKEDFLGMKEVVKKLWEGIKQIFSGALDVISGIFQIFAGLFTGDWEKMVEGIENVLFGLSDFILGIFNTVLGIIEGAIISVLKLVDNLVSVLTFGEVDLTGFFEKHRNKNVRSFQTGGIVPDTGLAYLHKGERIIPAGQTTNNVAPNITINANISSDYDVRRLADQLKRYWVEDFESLTQSRGLT